jgi:cytochrome c553
MEARAWVPFSSSCSPRTRQPKQVMWTAGRRKALACQTCHGLDGISKLPEAPHLAGQPEQYLVKSLDEYRTGMRRNEMMTLVVKNLSNQDIADLAAYYTAIEISAVSPK